MQNFILVLSTTILSILSNNLSANDIPISRGDVYIHEISKNDYDNKIAYKKNQILTINSNDRYFLMYGISYNNKSDIYPLTLSHDDLYLSVDINLTPKDFTKQYITIKNKYIQPSIIDLKRIKHEKETLNKARQVWIDVNPDIDFIKPLNGIYTGFFGTERYYNGKKGRYHNGLDIAAPEGTYISAPSSGKIILTGDYYYNGKFVFLDHGRGLKSLFIHLSDVLVDKNEFVEKGQIIGKVGNTGASAGPHLHWSLIMNKAYINPKLFIDGTISHYFHLKLE